MTPPSGYRWVVLAAGTMAQAAFATLTVGLASLAPALREQYRLTLREVGFVMTAVGLGMFLGMLPWGLLADRIGERTVIGVGLAGMGLALAFAAATKQLPYLVASLIAAGACGASANAASGRAIMLWFPIGERGLALGIRQASVPAGGALAAALLPWLSNAAGVRSCFLAISAVAFLGSGIGALLLRERDAREASAVVAPPRAVFRNGPVWRLSLSSVMLLLGQNAVIGFAVLLLHQHRGLGAGRAAAVLAVIQLLGIAGRVFAGRLSDRIANRMDLLRYLGIALAIAIACSAALIDGPLPLLVIALVVAGTIGMSWNGVAFTITAELAQAERSGTALGLQQTVIAAGVAVVPTAFAWLVSESSWTLAFAVVSVFPLVGALTLSLIPDLRANREHHQTISATSG